MIQIRGTADPDGSKIRGTTDPNDSGAPLSGSVAVGTDRSVDERRRTVATR